MQKLVEGAVSYSELKQLLKGGWIKEVGLLIITQSIKTSIYGVFSYKSMYRLIACVELL